MDRAGRGRGAWLLGGLVCACAIAASQQQQTTPGQLVKTGQILVDGHSTPYLIRHLPVSSFPQLPEGVARALMERGCLIPQTYQARGPENVVEASLERAGSRDWAVLCSARGMVSLLVFFGSAAAGDGGVAEAQVLASAVETERLQARGADGALGFNWGIDPATPERVHEAQAGMDKRPARVDHDALADTLVDRHTVYHFYGQGGWIVLAMPE
jgi:hypothetical protein